MNRSIRIALLVVLALGSGLFGWKFKTNYDRLMSDTPAADTDLVNVKLPDYQRRAAPLRTEYHLGAWGAGLLLSLIGAGLLLAHETSQFLATRAMKALGDRDDLEFTVPEYDVAEEEWNQGNFLEAVRLLREYLQKNPREQHAALRIAEIYEKDLHNPLAAALEYEEVLKQKLPAERWGWAAIHLCNLYTGKLGQPDKAVALLQRIVAEHGDTAAAEKARTRLAQLVEEGVIAPLPESAPEEENPPAQFPPGFSPKKT